MSRQLADNFNLRSKKFLDDREQFDTLAMMRAYREVDIPEGFMSFCVETKAWYRYDSTNEVDPDTGKWRIIKYGIDDGDDEGDGLAYVDDKWTIQKQYGYLKPGGTSYEDDVFFTLSGAGAIDVSGFVPGNSYEFKIDDFTQTVVADADGLITFATNPDWERVSYDHGRYYILGYPGSVSGSTRHVTIEGTFAGTYHEFDRRYIPAPARIYESDTDIPANEIRDGDIVYINHNLMDMELKRYKLTQEAANNGWTRDAWGIVCLSLAQDGYRYMWDQIAANEDDIIGTLIEPADDGNICRVKLVNGTFMYDAYEIVTTLYKYADKSAYIYDGVIGRYKTIYSEADFRDTHVPIENVFVKELPDNIYDE